MRENAEGRFIVVIRYRTGVTAAMRVVWRSRTFDILGIVNKDERRHFLTLDCQEAFV
jgi:SPP1 family predicted phage head-tail adaptor